MYVKKCDKQGLIGSIFRGEKATIEIRMGYLSGITEKERYGWCV